LNSKMYEMEVSITVLEINFKSLQILSRNVIIPAGFCVDLDKKFL
jgi:hypothetical protein